VSDITAMGGTATAAVDVHWSCSDAAMDGIAAAAKAFNVPIVGGHSGETVGNPQLAVAIVGHTEAPLFGHSAKAGDDLIAVIDQRGEWRGDFPFWNAATTAPPERLRGDLALIPQLSAADVLCCGRDISMGGIYQTAALIAERSGTVLDIDPMKVPGISDAKTTDEGLRRLLSFPSYGYLFSVQSNNSPLVLGCFAERNLAATVVG
jgi:selenophosphate synthetase-related protein